MTNGRTLEYELVEGNGKRRLMAILRDAIPASLPSVGMFAAVWVPDGAWRESISTGGYLVHSAAVQAELRAQLEGLLGAP